MPQYYNTRTKQIVASPENFSDKQLSDLGYTREKPTDFVATGTQYKPVLDSDSSARNVYSPVNIAEDIAGINNNIVGGDSRIRNEINKNKSNSNDILSNIDQYDTGLTTIEDFTKTPEYEKSNAELDAARKALGILTPEEQAQIEREAAAAGLEYDPLIRKAQEDKRQGFSKARVGAGEAGGFMNTQFAGLAALVPTEGGDFAGAGGELERVKSAYDQVISGLETQKRAAIERARSAARQAILTGKKDQYDIAKGEFDRVKGLYDSQLALAKEKATALQNVTKMKQEQIKFTWEYAKEITGAYIDVLDDGSISVPTDEEINRIARERGLDAATVKSYLNQRIDELRKLNIDERKLEIEFQKALKTDDDKILSPSEAEKLGVAYGTTVGQAKSMGIMPKSELDTQKKVDLELKIGQHFDTITKEARASARNINIIDEGYKQALAATENGKSLNAPSQAVLVTFQKMLDPTSVVRESEYARSAEGLSLINRIIGKYEKLARGGAGVTVQDLKEFAEMSKKLQEIYRADLKDFALRAKTQAENYGLDIENILTPSVAQLIGGGSTKEEYGSSADLLPEL